MSQKDKTPEDLPLVTVKFAEISAPNASTPTLSSASADDRMGHAL